MPHDPWLYKYIKVLFKVTSECFYHQIVVGGLENVPPEGVGTILVYNHANGLGDPVVVMAHCPRTIGFVAKDTLWKSPMFGLFIRGSGAVPVQRRSDHGDARDNTAAFSAMYEALGSGRCIAVAPEGNSLYRPSLGELRTGVARVLIETQRRFPKTKVCILPCGLTYTHREKWRSDVLMEYGKPVEVEAGAGDVKHIMGQVREALLSLTMCTHDWTTIRIATTACKLYLPSAWGERGSSRLTLAEYMHVVRHFVRVLQEDNVAQHEANVREPTTGGTSPTAAPSQLPRAWVATQKRLRDDARRLRLRVLLESYQSQLDDSKLRDERVRAAAAGVTRVSGVSVLLLRSVVNFVCAAVVGLAALPGICLWAPLWAYLRLYKLPRVLRRKGGVLENGDTLAELKMIFSFIWIVLLGSLIAGAAAMYSQSITGFGFRQADRLAPWLGFTPSAQAQAQMDGSSPSSLVLKTASRTARPAALASIAGVVAMLVLFFTMRAFESAVAFLRIALAMRALAMHTFFRPERMAQLVATRKAIEKEVLEVAGLTAAPRPQPKEGRMPARCCVGTMQDFVGFALRNNKRDWNEVLRLSECDPDLFH